MSVGSYCYLLFEATVLSYPLLQAAPKILLPSFPQAADSVDPTCVGFATAQVLLILYAYTNYIVPTFFKSPQHSCRTMTSFQMSSRFKRGKSGWRSLCGFLIKGLLRFLWVGQLDFLQSRYFFYRGSLPDCNAFSFFHIGLVVR